MSSEGAFYFAHKTDSCEAKLTSFYKLGEAEWWAIVGSPTTARGAGLRRLTSLTVARSSTYGLFLAIRSAFASFEPRVFQ
ncbi:MAG: hypothetical protein ABH875_07355 [Candidatus Omnitrophota bacterium]